VCAILFHFQDKDRQLKILQDKYDNIAKTLEQKQKDLIDLKQTIILQQASRFDTEENQNKQELIQNLIVALCQKSLEEFNLTSALKVSSLIVSHSFIHKQPSQKNISVSD